jgi:hypothetical protein
VLKGWDSVPSPEPSDSAVTPRSASPTRSSFGAVTRSCDLYLNNSFRVGGGLLFRNDDPTVKSVFTTDQDIGGTTYSPAQVGTLTGVFDAKDRAPYVLLGFGRHTQPGVGLFLDLGVVFVGEPEITLGATGGTLSPETDAAFRSALDQEATNMEQDAGSYLKLWPWLSLGVRVGLQN